jgi:hypothetical protein
MGGRARRRHLAGIGPPDEPARLPPVRRPMPPRSVHLSSPCARTTPEPWATSWWSRTSTMHPDPLTVFLLPARRARSCSFARGSFTAELCPRRGPGDRDPARFAGGHRRHRQHACSPPRWPRSWPWPPAVILRTSDFVGSLAHQRRYRAVSGRSGEAAGPGLLDAALRMFYQHPAHLVLAPLQADASRWTRWPPGCGWIHGPCWPRPAWSNS